MKRISIIPCMLLMLIISCTSEKISKVQHKTIDQIYADFPLPLETQYVDEYEGIEYTLPEGFSILSSKSDEQIIDQRAGPNLDIHCVCVEGQAFCEVVLPNKCFREVDCITCQISIRTKGSIVVPGDGDEALFIRKDGKTKRHANYQFLNKYEPLEAYTDLKDIHQSKLIIDEVKKNYTFDNASLVKVPVEIDGIKTILELDLESLIASGESFMYLLYQE